MRRPPEFYRRSRSGISSRLLCRRAKGPDFYSYFTIYAAGFSIFLILTAFFAGLSMIRL